MEVTFFPRSDYNIEVCAHRLGKSMTYTEDTDAFRGGAEQIAAIAESKGIKFSVFWALSTSSDDAYKLYPYFSDGKAWIDAYLHPTNSAVPGTVITQEVYEEERDKVYARIKELFNIHPVAMSYNSGNDTYKDYVANDFLGGRNSGGDKSTPYGIGYGSPSDVQYSKDFFKSKLSSSRWYDDSRQDNDNFTDRLAELRQDVIATKANGGWYNNFTHWHQVISNGHLEVYRTYLALLEELNVNNDIYFAGYGEAIAYLVYRQLITKAVMFSPMQDSVNKLVIRLETNNNVNVDSSLLVVPISIKFSTAGTPLAGQAIKCENRNLISLGNNKYIVEIPYDRFPVAVIDKVTT